MLKGAPPIVPSPLYEPTRRLCRQRVIAQPRPDHQAGQAQDPGSGQLHGLGDELKLRIKYLILLGKGYSVEAQYRLHMPRPPRPATRKHRAPKIPGHGIHTYYLPTFGVIDAISGSIGSTISSGLYPLTMGAADSVQNT